MKRRSYLMPRTIVRGIGALIGSIPLISFSVQTLQEVVDEAIQKGDSSVTLHTNYSYSTLGSAPALVISNKVNFTIDGDNHTLTVNTSTVSAIQIKSISTNITICNLLIKYAPVPFTQGKVVALPNDKSFTTVDIDTGYPLPPTTHIDRLERGVVHNPDSRAIKPNTSWRVVTNFTKVVSTEHLRRYRFQHEGPYNDDIAVGDQFSIPLPGDAPAIEILDSRSIFLQKVDIYASPGMGVVEKRSTGCSYDSLRIIPFSTPTDATNPQLRSSNADGLHSSFAEDGPIVINSTFNSCGDDAIAIHGRFGKILSTASNSKEIIVGFDGYTNTYQKGNHINIYKNGGTGFVQNTVTNVIPIGKPNSYDYAAKLQLLNTCSVSDQDIIDNEECIGSGYYVAGNTITYNRARGLSLKGQQGCIYTNHISHIMSCGILLKGATELGGVVGEGGFSRNIEIKGNTLTNICIGFPESNRWDAGAICMVAEPGTWGNRGHYGITLESNKVSNARGINLQIMNAKGVIVKDCEFENTHVLGQGNGRGSGAGLITSTVVWMDQCDGVAFIGTNKITNPSAYTTSFCEIAAGAANVTGTNNIHR